MAKSLFIRRYAGLVLDHDMSGFPTISVDTNRGISRKLSVLNELEMERTMLWRINNFPMIKINLRDPDKIYLFSVPFCD